MEVTFKTNKLRQMFLELRVAERELGKTLARRYIQRIRVLSDAKSLGELAAMPWLRCHQLKGERKGEWAINLDDFQRLIFVVIDRQPEVIRIEEISKLYGN